MTSERYTIISALFSITLIPQVSGHAQVYFTGQKFISEANDPTELSQEGLTGVLSTLLNIKPVSYVGSSVSQQMERVILPIVFSRPEALFSLQALFAPGDFSSQYLIPEERIHSAIVKADKKIAASAKILQALSSVAYEGVSTGTVEHHEFGKALGCSDACMEELLKEALSKMGGNYTVGSAALKGVAYFPEASDKGMVEIELNENAGRVWAVELATLHQAARDLAQTRQQQLGSFPKLYEATVVSPKLLSEKYGAASPKTQAAVNALSSAVDNLLEVLKEIHDDRMVTHLAILDDAPIRKNDARATLQWHEQQQRRHLLMSDPAGASATDSATSWFVQAAAYISALLLLVFALASCQVLAKMQFKQDSLLYARTKAE